MNYYILKNENDGRVVRSIDRSGPKPTARYMSPDDSSEMPMLFRYYELNKLRRTATQIGCKFVEVEIVEIG